jgi:MFS transporter, OFA family, oxalate/formate antiporter
MLVAYAPGAFFAGRLAERYGPRRVLLAAALLIALGFSGCRFSNSLTVMILSYAVIGVGLGATLALPTATIMRWFVKLRGIMVGLVNAGSGIGGLIFAPAANSLITAHGWRVSYLIIGLTLGGIVALGAAFLVSNPAKKGLQPFGSREQFSAPVQHSQPAKAPAMTLARAFKNSTFRGIAVLYILCCVPVFFFLSHIVPYITDRGVSPDVAAQGLGLIAAMGAAGPVLSSWLAGKLGWMRVLAACALVAAGSIAWLLFIHEASMFYAFVIFFGLSTGSTMALLNGVVGVFFGLASVAELLGFLLGLSVMFGGLSPWLGGLIFDLTQSYFVAAVITIAILAAAGLTALLLRPPKAQFGTVAPIPGQKARTYPQ